LRNSLLSMPGRPSPSLTGVAMSCINLSLFLLRLQLPPSCLPVLAPALLAILGLALVGIYTSAALGHPSHISLPLFSTGFLRFSSLEISTLIRPFSRGSRLFSLFGNLILVQADASFSLSQNCQSCLYKAITCENAPTRSCILQSLLLILKPTWYGMCVE
jgi:hypothetical protein